MGGGARPATLGRLRHPVPHPALGGFDHVNRFWDQTKDRVHAKILPGEYYVTTADEVISTVLGSCVAACIWDPEARIGGMNHFMIPSASRTESGAPTDETARYGLFAMEYLINTILKHGGERSRLQTKIVGGGHVMAIATDIGQRNIDFVRRYLAAEGLPLAGECVGGPHPMKAVFHPVDGRAQVLAIKSRNKDTVVKRERSYADHLRQESGAGAVELF